MDGIPPLLPQTHDNGELYGKLNKLYAEHSIGDRGKLSYVRTWPVEQNSSHAMKMLSDTESILHSA